MKKCQIKTIDARHNRFIKNFKNELNSKDNLEDEIKELENNFNKYHNMKKKTMTDEDFEDYNNIKEN